MRKILADRNDPPTQSQIDTLGWLYWEREEIFSLETIAEMARTSGGAASAIRTLRLLKVKPELAVAS